MPEPETKLVEEARFRDAEIASIWGDLNRNFYDLGEHAEIVYRKELYKFLCDDAGKPFDTGDAWLYSRIPDKGRSTVYRARKHFRELEVIPRADRVLVKQCNAPVLGQLSDSVKTRQDIIEAAQTLPERKFKDKIKAEFPEQNIEDVAPVKLNPTASQRTVMDRAIAVETFIQQADGGTAPDREHALEGIFAKYLEDKCSEMEAYVDFSRQEMYDHLHPDESNQHAVAKAAHA